LGSTFFLPLLLSPLISLLLTMPLYKIGHVLSRRFGVTRESCVCVAPGQFVPVAAFTEANVALAPEAISPQPLVAIGTAPVCMNKYNGSVWGITAQKLVDNIHYVSAAAVSFARGQRRTQNNRSFAGNAGVESSGQHVGSGCSDGDRRLAKCP